MSEVGFEPTPPFGDQNTQFYCVLTVKVDNLESGALDRSAILTRQESVVLNIRKMYK